MKYLLTLLCLFLFSFNDSPPLTGRVPVYAKNGMVVSASMLASEIGRDILRKGGNAMDAAVATAFALAVTWPEAGNIGGGGFIVYVPAKGEPTSFDFREKAPLAANEKMYLNAQGELIKDLNHEGLLSVGVPGTVAGLFDAHQKYGKLPWKKLVDPAVRLAKNGFPFTYALHTATRNNKKDWDKYPSTMKVMFKPDGEFYELGEIWKQPDLAATLKRIRDKGKDGFYNGETATRLAAFMKANGGLITMQDLEQYKAVERKPMKGNYRGYTIYTVPPPSSGGVALIEMLNILEGYDLKSMGFGSADYVHLVTEAMRRAYADRAEFMGDPDFNTNLPVEKLTSKEYAAALRKTVDMNKVSLSDSSRFGQIYDGGSNTTHLSVVDKEGNAVSLTYTLEESYGSKVVAEGLGFFLNDEMGDFNPVPGKTTGLGQIGSTPNLIAPGKRMLSSMTPTIVTKDGKPLIVVGSPGGKTIINTVMQVIINVIDHNMNIGQAVEAPRFHHQWLPDKIEFEHHTLSPETQLKLKEKGHVLAEKPVTTIRWPGHAMCIMINSETGFRMGAADSRAPDGGVAGY